MLGQHARVIRRSHGGIFRWYYLAAAFFLANSMEAFTIIDRIVYGDWGGKPGDKLTQCLNLLQIVVSVLLSWRAFRRSGTIRTGGKLALALAIILFLSLLWSIDPETTNRRGVLYLFFVIGTIGVAGNLAGDEYMDLLCAICFVSAALSIALLVASPGYVISADSADFRGIFASKNVLGQVMAAGVLASLHGIRVGGNRRLPNFIMLFVFLAVTLAAKSATSLMTTFAYCGASGVYVLFRHGGTCRIVGILLVVLLTPIAIICSIFPDVILEMIGKDPTLTGRTELWALVLGYVYERPILGWGLTAFWSPANPASSEISSAVGWGVAEAHNGLLEMLLEVGIVGTGLFVLLLLRNAALALRCLSMPGKEFAMTSLLCYGGIVMVGVSELVLVDPSQVSVSMFFITGMMCERMIQAARRRRISTMYRGVPAGPRMSLPSR